MPVLGLVLLRWRGHWTRSNAWAESWIGPIAVVGVLWLTLEIINLAWPRTVTSDWYLNWGIIIMTGVLGVVGAMISWRVFKPGSPAALASHTVPDVPADA
jgi:hypothetical protein